MLLRFVLTNHYVRLRNCAPFTGYFARPADHNAGSAKPLQDFRQRRPSMGISDRTWSEAISLPVIAFPINTVPQSAPCLVADHMQLHRVSLHSLRFAHPHPAYARCHSARDRIGMRRLKSVSEYSIRIAPLGSSHLGTSNRHQKLLVKRMPVNLATLDHLDVLLPSVILRASLWTQKCTSADPSTDCVVATPVICSGRNTFASFSAPRPAHEERVVAEICISLRGIKC